MRNMDILLMPYEKKVFFENKYCKIYVSYEII